MRSVILPVTWFNITEANNGFQLNDIDGGLVTAFLPYGRYSISSLLTYLQTNISALGDGNSILWGYDTPSKKFTISVTLNGGYPGVIKFGNATSIANLLGFPKADIPFANSGVIASPVSIDTLEYTRVFIASSALSGGMGYRNVFKPGSMNNYNMNIIESIPVPPIDGGRIIYTTSFKKRWPSGGRFSNNWDFQLLDDRGNPLVLNSPMSGWQMEIVITY